MWKKSAPSTQNEWYLIVKAAERITVSNKYCSLTLWFVDSATVSGPLDMLEITQFHKV